MQDGKSDSQHTECAVSGHLGGTEGRQNRQVDDLKASKTMVRVRAADESTSNATQPPCPRLGVMG